MSKLPTGYTELEYIQSSGTQYIDTGVKPSNNTQVSINFNANPIKNNTEILGARNSGVYYELLFENYGSPVLYLQYGSKTPTVQVSAGAFNLKISNGKLCNISTGAIMVDASASGTFSISNTLYLFALHNASGGVERGIAAKLYSCTIYNENTMVRDFVPCKNVSGAVGLYDTVEGQFYANAGTGTFTAGPEVVYEPDAPTNFSASVSGQTVALSWSASANAAGYRLKRDGVQIAEQTGTTYTDTVPDGTTLCTYALTAYNDTGESVAVTLLVLVQLELVTDRTRADVANQTDKGFYNASDLNRVGAAVEYIAGRFTALGYACPVTVKKDWLTSDAPTASQMEAYRQNIVTLRSQIAVMQSTPEAPASMAGLNYIKANNIEQILLDLDALITNITKSLCFSGEVYAGEV